MKRKPKAFLSWNRNCEFRCERGWLTVEFTWHGEKRQAVERCKCVKIVAPEAKLKKAKRHVGQDFKSRGAGETL